MASLLLEAGLALSSLLFTLLFSFAPILIFIVVIFIFIFSIISRLNKIKRNTSEFANTVWGTDNLSEIVNQNDLEIRETPKSVSAMTSVYLPILQRDFPELNWDEFKNSAVQELKKNLSLSYDSFRIHRTELYRYVKSGGTCTVIFQSSVEYMLDGLKNQTRYNTHMVYIQNGELAGDASAFSTTCPNCGAPISTLGNMKCEYCDSVITPVNMKVWRLLKVEEIA